MDKKLHVLQVHGIMLRGGAEIMTMDICRHLSSDMQVDFLINTKKDNHGLKGDFDDEIEQLGGRLRHIGTQWELGPIKYIAQFKKIIKDIGKPDVVHIHLNAKCGIIALAARLSGIKKIIAHCHGERLVPRGSFFNVLARTVELKLQRLLVALFATDYWGCSEKACESLFYRRVLRQDKAIVINNAMDVEAFHSVPEEQTTQLLRSYGVNDNTFIVGNTGRVVRRKELGFIIDVLEVLDRKRVDFLFVCAGRVDDNDYMSEVLGKVKEKGLENNVLFLGDCDNIPTVLSTFDAFVSPARDEAFGMVAAEAQAAGLPCILSTGFPQAVDLNLGLVSFVDNSDPEEWAVAILRIRDHKCLDRDMIRNRIKERGFDADENAKRIEAMYRA